MRTLFRSLLVLGLSLTTFAVAAADEKDKAKELLGLWKRTAKIKDKDTTIELEFLADGKLRVEWLETVIPVDRGPEGIDVSPDGHDAWVANAQDGTISLIDLEHKRLRGILSADVKGANRLKFTPDGKLVFVSTLSGPEVTVLRSLTGSVVKRVPVGHGAAGIVIQPDGARAYVACTPDDSVAVIDVRSLTVVGRIGAGGRPDGLAWAERP